LHRVFRLLHDFCSVQISSMYGNAMKDRLYCESPKSPLRRQTQTVMHRIVLALTKLLAPICVFTADEAWQHITHRPGEEATLASVHMALLPTPSGVAVSEAQRAEWKMLLDLRGEALGQIDKITRQVGKYKALDAELVFEVADASLRQKLAAYGPDLEDMAAAGCYSFVEPAAGASAAVTVKVIDRRDTLGACARCWKRRGDVGGDAEYPDLCGRCAPVVREAKMK
jgi:isoleucyl-tRNA synthetase